MADPIFSTPAGQPAQGRPDPQGGFSPPTMGPIPQPKVQPEGKQDSEQAKETFEPLPPNHPKAQKPLPLNYTERLSGLQQVHPWMPPQTMATVAALPATDQAVAQIAASLRKAYGTVDNAIKYVTDDPVLQKEPSLGLAVRAYLTNTTGPWPLADSDLVHVQKQLMKQGYGKGLPTDGVWNNGWNGALSQYAQDQNTKALGGDQPGSTPLGHVLGWMNSLLPQQAATAVTAFVKSIPQSVQSDLHTLAGSVGGGLSNVAYQLEPKQLFSMGVHEQPKLQQGQLASTLENAVTFTGPKTTPATSFPAEGVRSQTANVVQTAMDILATHGILKAGGAIASAAGENGAKLLTREEAERGPGTIAKSILNKDTGGKPTGILSRTATTNNPILKMTGPVVDQLASKDGFYFKARNLVASPYRYGPVRTAGTAIGQLGIAGAKVQANASLGTALQGQTSDLQSAINHMRAINQFNDALQTKLGFTVLGQHFSPGINTLAWFLHPPFDGPGALSEGVGRDVSKTNEHVLDAFGDSTGFGIQIERAVNAGLPRTQHVTLDQLVDQAGGPANFNHFWTDKILQHAAAHLAEVKWSELGAQEQAEEMSRFGGRPEVLEDMAMRAQDKMAQGDGNELMSAAAEMLTNEHAGALGEMTGRNELSKRIAAEMDRSGGGNGNIQNYAEASRLMRDVIVPRQNEMLLDQERGKVGMATLSDDPEKDYLTGQQATTEANELEQEYKQAVADQAAGASGPIVEQAESKIRGYLVKHYGIDPDKMPAQTDSEDPAERTLIKLLHTKADNQAAELFLRERPIRLEPDAPTPQLHQQFNRDEVGNDEMSQPGPLNEKTGGSVYTNLSPRAAFDLLYESPGHSVHKWENDQNRLTTNRGITIEHDPANVHGVGDRTAVGAIYQAESRGRARFNGARTSDALDGVKSVEIRPVRGENQAATTARRLLTTRLQDAGYVPFDKGSGVVRWVRDDLTGGTIPTSPQLRAAVARLNELGFKPVVGKGIGFDFYDHPLVDVMDSKLTRAKRIMEALGISPENIHSSDIGFDFKLRLHRYLNEAVADGKITLPVYYSTHTLMADMTDKDILPANTGLATVIAKSVGRHSYNNNLERLTDAYMPAKEMSQVAARKAAEADLSNSLENPLGLMHIKEADLKAVLGRKVSENKDRPQESQIARELEFRHDNADKTSANPKPLSDIYESEPLMDNASIHEVYRAIQKAKAEMPSRLVGWQNLENIASLGLSYLGRPIPGSAGRVIENLPTRLVSLRNKFRFQLSPEFSARRVVKVMAKMSLDDIPPTFTPRGSLEKAGVYKSAQKYLDKIMPELKNQSYDEGTQAFYAEDPWGMYNHREHEMYGAWMYKQAGHTDDEVRQMLVRNFGYGSKEYGEGRSALERSANFVFFPLSFDKTLYRNFGAYMLDHTAQRLIIQRGLEMYNQYNQADPDGSKLLSSGWFEKHMPIAQEALRLNAFAHGVGLGQFGGINAPILNLFIPQQYQAGAGFEQFAKGFVPALTEFHNVSQEIIQQSKIAWQLTEDQLHPVKPGVWFAAPVAETSNAQLTDAYAYRRALNSALSKYIEYNAHHSQKYSLPQNTDKFGGWAGSTINSTLVDGLVHQKYPAFQIEDPSVYYAKASAAVAAFTHRMNTQGHLEVSAWIGAAQKIGTAIYRNKLNSTEAAAYTKRVRGYAVRFAEEIPGFLTFYNSNFRWQYGPLEAVR